MARHRLAVVLLVEAPTSVEVDGLRRALGDATLGRVPAHVTLVPPVNVREDALPDAFDVVHAAAAACPALPLVLGPVRTFAPVNPVAYLAVTGEPTDLVRLDGLREALHTGPLDRPAEHAFVPHVTVAPELPEDRLAASEVVLAAYRVEVVFERIHVLAEQPGRVWTPVGEARLGAA